MSVKRLRVYVTSFDRLPCSLVRSLVEGASGIELVGEGSNRTRERTVRQLLFELERHRPDLLIVCVESAGELDRYARLFGTSVLLVSPRGRKFQSYPERHPMVREEEFSGSHLLSVIRGESAPSSPRNAARGDTEAPV